MTKTGERGMSLQELVDGMRDAFGTALGAVVLHGSTARTVGPADDSTGHDVMVIVRELPVAGLRKSHAAVLRWIGAGNPAPLVLTEAEWRSSHDIFAIEMADLLERHQILFGALPAGAPPPDVEHLRHQLEFEAMGKLLRFRQALQAATGDPAAGAALLRSSRAALLVLFRTLLRVHGEPVPAEDESLVRQASGLAGFDPDPFLALVASPLPGVPGTLSGSGGLDTVLVGCHQGLMQLVAHVDAQMRTAPGPVPAPSGDPSARTAHPLPSPSSTAETP